MALETVVKALQEYDGIRISDLLSHGKEIGNILLNSVFENDSEENGDSQMLTDIFSTVESKKYFIHNEEHFFISIVIKKNGERVSMRSSDLLEMLDKMKQPAQFGDLEKQMTRVDEKIRKGFDIRFGTTINDLEIVIGRYYIDKLKNIIQRRLKYFNVNVVPYKVNIYEEGDFFTEHRDSPDEGLIGTLIYVYESNTGCFHLDGKPIAEGDGTIIFFQPEILHEVKPVSKKRITITFKVFSEQPIKLDDKEVSDVAKKLNMRISSNDGILLSSGYSFFKGENNFVPKGKDVVLIQALEELGYKYTLYPVILSDMKKYNLYYGEEKFDDFIKLNTVEKDSMEVGDQIVVYDLDKKIKDYLNIPENNIVCKRIFCLGLGYKVGEKGESNVYIGNEHTGAIESNIYYNLLLVLH